MKRRLAAVGVDTGGTFTDICWSENGRLRARKLPSTPDDPSRAVGEGLRDTLPGRPVVHGTTVATNTLLEGKLGRTAFVTNAGFEDLIEIGRQARPEIYALEPAAAPVPVPRALRFGIAGRLGPEGETLQELDVGELEALGERLRDEAVEAVAVGLLHAYGDGTQEECVGRALERCGAAVCLSHRVSPEHREYERFMTTIVNAGLVPRVAAYLGRLAERLGARPLTVMNSAGGTLGPAAAGELPVQTNGS
jgi:N-methylhydantoinase A